MQAVVVERSGQFRIRPGLQLVHGSRMVDLHKPVVHSRLRCNSARSWPGGGAGSSLAAFPWFLARNTAVGCALSCTSLPPRVRWRVSGRGAARGDALPMSGA